MKTLTDIDCKNLGPAPEGKRVEVRDAMVPGLALRITDNGAKSWVLIYFFGGRKRRLTLGTYGPHPGITLSEARNMGRKAIAKVLRGEDPGATKAAARAAQTIGEFAKEYMEWAKEPTGPLKRPRKRSWKDDHYMLDVDVAPWNARKIQDITRADAIKLLDGIRKRAPIKANRVRSLLSGFFTLAREKGLIEHNVMRDIKAEREAPREFQLTPEQVHTLWDGIEGLADDPELRDFYKMAFFTLARRTEVLGMRWDELDLEAGVWVLSAERTKNKRAWRVPLSPSATALLRERKARSTSERVFDAQGRGLLKKSTLWNHHRAFVAKVGIEFRCHDTRSIGISQIAQWNYDSAVLDVCLAHVTRGITARHYDRFKREPEHRRALERWASWLENRGEVNEDKVAKWRIGGEPAAA